MDLRLKIEILYTPIMQIDHYSATSVLCLGWGAVAMKSLKAHISGKARKVKRAEFEAYIQMSGNENYLAA
jgi:hypothetical protein